jgi:hypothetical protein
MSEQKNQKFLFKEGFNPIHDISDEEMKEYLIVIRERKFILSDTGITSRVFNLWKKLKLIDIPQSRDTRPSIKLNFSDYIWLKIISDLRCFGCSLTDIERIKELCNTSKELEIINQEEILGLVMKDLKSKNIRTSSELEAIEKNLKAMDWQKDVNEIIGKPLTQIEKFILLMLFNKSDSYLLVYIDNEFENSTQPAEEKKTQKPKGLYAGFMNDEIEEGLTEIERQSMFNNPHMKLPLKRYVTEFILNFKVEKQVMRLKLLNEDELNLLHEIRRGDVNEIKIIFSNTQIDRIEVKKDIQKDVQARLIETFRKNEYAEITYKIQNGKMIDFKKTTKIKFNK